MLRPFSSNEHSAFLQALERHGPGAEGGEWDAITRTISTRTPKEVALHAHQYFLLLQAMTDRSAAAAEEDAEPGWTRQEDCIFEAGLAQFEEEDANRWKKLALLLPEKSEEDVRKRYQKLLSDITAIEGGHVITVKYKASKTVEEEDEEAAPVTAKTAEEKPLPMAVLEKEDD